MNLPKALLATAGLIALQLAALPAAALAKDCGDNGGITLSPGFCATIFADKLGHARQMVVAPNGTLYVNTWSGVYYNNDTPPDGGFLLALKDTTGAGKADVIQRFGETVASGGHGGTGIGIYDGGLYAEINDKIVRYALTDDPAPKGAAETVISGLPITGDHPMHPFAIDTKGALYVDLGSATNACEVKNRMPQSRGNDPCTEKETRGGIWRYDATKRDQAFSAAERFTTGIRNGEGLAFDASGRIFSTQHGRDQLGEDWPQYYTATRGRELPAEEIIEIGQGVDAGWPECYFDGTQKKLILAPEYGGDSKKVGVCATRKAPVAFFPAHWAPNDMKIYLGDKFPSAYQGGAFVAFHGSWNRAPGPQGGYNVVYQPLKDGKAAGPYIVFADGFTQIKEPGRASHRPTGLAVGPDGALYISDDVGGRIWKVTYQGGASAKLQSAPAPKQTATASPDVLPPEGVHPDAGKPLPVPAGSTKAQVALGGQVFAGKDGATCGGCHGSNAEGSPIGANLTAGTYLWSDGSLAGIEKTIRNGVPEPKEHLGGMPPLGGAQLSEVDVKAVAAYVWAVGHKSGN